MGLGRVKRGSCGALCSIKIYSYFEVGKVSAAPYRPKPYTPKILILGNPISPQPWQIEERDWRLL